MSRYRMPRTAHISAGDRALIATFEPIQPPSRTTLAAMPAQLRPLLDPFPFERDTEAQHNLCINTGRDRLVWTAQVTNPAALRAAARAAGWGEINPDKYQAPAEPGMDDLATLLVRDVGEPNAALLVDGLAACSRYNAEHLADPSARLWPNVQPQRM